MCAKGCCSIQNPTPITEHAAHVSYQQPSGAVEQQKAYNALSPTDLGSAFQNM